MLPPVQLSAVEMVRWFCVRCWIRVWRVFMGRGFLVSGVVYVCFWWWVAVFLGRRGFGTPGGVEGMWAGGVQLFVLARLRRRDDVDIVCTTEGAGVS